MSELTSEKRRSPRIAPAGVTPKQRPTYVTSPRASGTRKCPGCFGLVDVHLDMCPECGDNLRTTPKEIRCRRCGSGSSPDLVLCPSCGRELLPAAPRVFTVGAPVVMVLLFLIVLGGQLQPGGFLSRQQPNAVALNNQPLQVMTPIPPQQDAAVEPVVEAPGASVNDASVAKEQQAETVFIAPVAPVVEAQPPAEAAPEPEDLARSEAAVPDSEPETGLPNGDVDAVVALAASAEVAQGEGEVTTESDAGAEEPAAEQAVVARQFLLPTATLPSGESAEDAGAAGQSVTESPSASITPTAELDVVAAASAGLEPITYEIRNGDTLIRVAALYNVTVVDLLQANNMTERDAYSIRPGQVLVIPVDPETVVGATVVGLGTGGAVDQYRLDVPLLRSPSDGVVIGCGETATLSWAAVPYMRADDRYMLHLGFVTSGSERGSETVMWVLAQARPANITSWELDRALCSLAPAALGRQWRWWVEVVEEVSGSMVSASPPSEVWGFVWQE
jgi:LysM repeat protein/RNA polymerase subunit RPABC4/transcription elongation factor Spt4